MKALNLSIFAAAGILLMGLLNSCESESTEFPATIGFTSNTADIVFPGESYNLKGSVTAEGTIESIHFYRSYTSPIDSTKLDSVEMAATQIVNINANTCDFSITVPNIKDATNTVTVVVIEKGGFKVASKHSIRVANINSFKDIQMGGWNSNYQSACDLNTGKHYGSGSVGDPAVGAIIDVYFDEAKLASTDLDAKYYGNVARFPDTGTKFATTTFTVAEFNSYKVDDAFKSMTATLSTIDIKAGDVVFFETKGGKKGLIKITSLLPADWGDDPENAPIGDLMIDVKIQK